MPRPCHCRRIARVPKNLAFFPGRMEFDGADCVSLGLDELEALRLADYEGLGMDEASRQMGISRHTFGRLLRRARYGVAQALCEGRGLRIGGGSCALAENGQDLENGENILAAVPSECPGGLDAAPEAHLGHCMGFTIARIVNGEILDAQFTRRSATGQCASIGQELAQKGVNILLARGMGMRILASLRSAGIKVFYMPNEPTVQAALEAFAAGRLNAFGEESQDAGGFCIKRG